jgi:hypothetical protein
MPADALEDHRRPVRVAVARPAAGDERHLSVDGDPVERELPADQPRERVHRGRVQRQVRERAQAGDAGRLAVVALGLGADHGGADAAFPAFEDHAVAVDEEVVTDVVPAVGVAVVARDPEHDPRGLLGRVVDGGGGVVDERRLDRAIARTRARRHLVGAPARARDDVGPAGLGAAGAGRRRVRQRAHEAQLEVAAMAAQPELDLVGGAGEGRLGARDVRGVGSVQRGPARPAAAARARSDLGLHARAGRPAQAGEVEAARRAQHARRVPALR